MALWYVQCQHAVMKRRVQYQSLKIVDGLPLVNEEHKPVLIRFLFRKVNVVGRIRDGEESIFIPMDDTGSSKGYRIHKQPLTHIC